MTNLNTNLTLDKNTLETWFLARLIQDPNFSKIILKDFNKRLIRSDIKSLAARLILKFVEKYDRGITLPEFNKLLQLYANSPRGNQTDLNESTIQQLSNEISDVILSCKEDFLHDTTTDFFKRQLAWSAIVDSINGLEKDPEKSVEKCLDRLTYVQQLELTPTNLGLDYFNEEAYNNHFEVLSNPGSKLPTGWDGIDELTHGGFLALGKSLYLFIGQPGLGKSLVLSNIAVNFLKQNKTVVVISLEMSEDVYAQRFDAHISNLDINDLANQEEPLKSRIRAFSKYYPNARLFIKDFPPRTITTVHIERYLNDLIVLKGIKPDAIIIDYLNLVMPVISTGDNMFKGGLEVSEKFRALSYKFEVPIITATQVNTEGMNNANVGMEHISESRGISHTCDFIGGLFKPENSVQSDLICCKVLKNRLGGEVGRVVPFKLHPTTLVLTDISGKHVSDNSSSGPPLPSAMDDSMFTLFDAG